MLTARDALLIPFSLFWGGFALVWNLSAWRMDTPLFFRLFGFPFMLVGLYLVIGRFFVDAWIRARLRYVVTDRRVVIVREGRGAGTKSLDIRRLPAIELHQRPDGTGTIRFLASSLASRRSIAGWTPALSGVPQFIRIPDVRSVHELIQRQADARHEPGS